MSNLAILEVSITDITMDREVQCRDSLKDEVVKEYCELMEAGTEFPAVTVCRDGEMFWLVDGFHRIEAAKLAGRSVIGAEVLTGSRRDAILLAVGANVQHGLRRSNADKRCAVMKLLTDPEWGDWSDALIAEKCLVSPRMVGMVRAELEATMKISHSETRKGKDGRTVKPNRRGRKRKSTDEKRPNEGDQTATEETAATVPEPQADVEPAPETTSTETEQPREITLEQALSENEELKGTVREKDAEIERLQSRIGELEQNIEDLTAENRRLRDTVASGTGDEPGELRSEAA